MKREERKLEERREKTERENITYYLLPLSFPAAFEGLK
jgi:hypothetical protein